MIIKQGPGKIDWCDVTWNPLSGCKNGCKYCYMQRLIKRFNFDMTPKFYPERLNDLKKLKKPTKIFVCSSGDIFSKGMKDKWIQAVIDKMKEYPQHIFQILTKVPERYNDFIFPENCWLGSCVDGTKKTLKNIKLIQEVNSNNLKFLSFEPLIEFEEIRKTGLSMFTKLRWIIIGGDSNAGAVKPSNEWADKIIQAARKLDIPIWMKDNYKYSKKIKEWPK